MRIPLAWLERECGGRVDREELLDILHASGVRASLDSDQVMDVEPPPELVHLGSVCGLAAEIRARNGAMPSAPLGPLQSLPAGLAVTADERVPGRIAAAVVTLPGTVGLPAAAADWLRTAGVRLTGTVADLMAYVALETGQPLGSADGHVLDPTGLRLGTADKAESVAYDPPDRTGPLPAGTWTLSAGERVVAVLGWDVPPTAVPADGRATLVWSWWLDPAELRRAHATGAAPDMVGVRGVRGHDPGSCDRAVARLGELITDWAGGSVTAWGHAGRAAAAPRVLRADAEELCRLVDPELDLTTLTSLLAAGGAAVRAEGGRLRVTVDAARSDLDCVPALAGEAARVRGYRTVSPRLPPSSAGPWPDRERLLREALAGTALRRGLQQVLTPVLLRSSEPLSQVGTLPEAEPVTVHGRAGLRDMRVRGSLLPGLLTAAGRSLRRTGAAQVFELGQIPLSASYRDETWSFAVVLGGASTPASLVDPQPRTVGFADLTGLLHAVARAAGQEAPELSPRPHAHFVGGASYMIRVQGVTVGRAGLLSDDTAALVDAAGERLFCAELDLTALGGLPTVPVTVRLPEPLPLPAFNVTVVVPDAVSAADVLQVVAEAGRTQRRLVTVKDLLKGGRVPVGHISLTVRAEFTCQDAGPLRAERRRRREAALRALGERGWSGQ